MKLGRYAATEGRGFTLASYVFLFSVLVYCAGWRFTRELGMAGITILTLTTLPFFFYPSRVRINPYLMVFCAITAVYVLLSLLEVFDRSWTRFFDPFTALRQGFYAIGLPLFVIAAESTSRHFRTKGKENQMFFWLLIFGGIIGPILLTILGDSKSDTFANRFQLNTLINIEILFILAIGYFLLASEKVPKWLGLIICAALLFFSAKLQAMLAILLLTVMLLGAPPRLVMFGSITGMIILILSILPFGAEFSDIDPNTGVRIFMWQDAIRAFVDSNGLGIGFGTEYITNFYPYHSSIQLTEFKREGYQYIGNHSSFFSILMRMGIIGLVSFFLFLFSFMPTKGRLYRNIKGDLTYKGDPFLCWIFTILVLSFASNVALASLNFFIGNAFVIGYLMSFRITEKSRL